MGLDGKNHFAGCVLWRREDKDSRSRRFIPILASVEEDVVIDLFKNKGCLTSVEKTQVSMTGTCGRILRPGSGGRGERVCRTCSFILLCCPRCNILIRFYLLVAYPHIDTNNVSVQARMVKRPCSAKLTIWYCDRRAIVKIVGPHNHPVPLEGKVPPEGKQMYSEAVVAAGSSGSTVANVNKGAESIIVIDD